MQKICVKVEYEIIKVVSQLKKSRKCLLIFGDAHIFGQACPEVFFMRWHDAKVSRGFAAGAPRKSSPLNFQKRGNNFSLSSGERAGVRASVLLTLTFALLTALTCLRRVFKRLGDRARPRAQFDAPSRRTLRANLKASILLHN